MVRVEIDDETEHAEVNKVVVCIEPEDIHLARDHRGQFLVYDEQMEPVHGDTDPPTHMAIKVAKLRAGWPATDDLDWEEGPDPLRFPDLYDDPEPDQDDEDDDLEPLDLTDSPARTTRPSASPQALQSAALIEARLIRIQHQGQDQISVVLGQLHKRGAIEWRPGQNVGGQLDLRQRPTASTQLAAGVRYGVLARRAVERSSLKPLPVGGLRLGSISRTACGRLRRRCRPLICRAGPPILVRVDDR